MLRRYWLFVGENYYPGGGMRDFLKSFDTFDDAMSFLLNGPWRKEDEGPERFHKDHMWYEVFDSLEEKVYRHWHGWKDLEEVPVV